MAPSLVLLAVMSQQYPVSPKSRYPPYLLEILISISTLISVSGCQPSGSPQRIEEEGSKSSETSSHPTSLLTSDSAQDAKVQEG